MTSNLSNEDLIHAVDLEVIRDRIRVASETTSTRENFRQTLLERDPNCVWTGVKQKYCSTMHIIPHRRGSEVRSTHLVLVHYLIVSLYLGQTLVAEAHFTKSTQIR